MAALMVALLASAIATLGSRWSALAAVSVVARGTGAGGGTGANGGLGWVPVVVTAALGCGLAAFFGAEVAARYRGPGMLLLLALALGFAAPALLWPVRPLGVDVVQTMRRPISATVLLAAALISDSAPFIVFAVTAWTGGWMLAGIGGAAGMLLAALATMLLHGNTTPPQLLRWVRAGLGVLLLFIAIFTAMAALGAR